MFFLWPALVHGILTLIGLIGLKTYFSVALFSCVGFHCNTTCECSKLNPSMEGCLLCVLTGVRAATSKGLVSVLGTAIL